MHRPGWGRPRVICLGPPAVTVDGRSVSFGRRQTHLLVYVLASEDRRAPASVIMTMLWPELAPQRRFEALAEAMADLRAALPGAILEFERSWLRLSEVDVDTRAVDAAAELHGDDEDATAKIAAALTGVTGEFLEGLSIPGEELLSWREARRAQLAARTRVLRRRLALESPSERGHVLQRVEPFPEGEPLEWREFDRRTPPAHAARVARAARSVLARHVVLILYGPLGSGLSRILDELADSPIGRASVEVIPPPAAGWDESQLAMLVDRAWSSNRPTVIGARRRPRSRSIASLEVPELTVQELQAWIETPSSRRPWSRVTQRTWLGRLIRAGLRPGRLAAALELLSRDEAPLHVDHVLRSPSADELLHDSLGPQCSSLLQRLCVFEGQFEPEAAARVAGVSVDELEALVEALVVRRRSEAYEIEPWARPSSLYLPPYEVAERHLAWVISDPSRPSARDVLSAWMWSFGPARVRLAHVLMPRLAKAGGLALEMAPTHLVESTQAAVVSSGLAGHPVEGYTLLAWARSCMTRGDPRARTLLEQAREVLSACDEPDGVAHATLLLARLHAGMGLAREATRLIANLAPRADQAGLAADLELVRALAALSDPEPGAGVEAVQGALAAAEGEGPDVVDRVRVELAEALHARGEYEPARALLSQVLARRKVEDALGGWGRLNFAEILVDAGEYQAVGRWVDELLGLAHRPGDAISRARANVLGALARAGDTQTRDDEAELREALALLASLGDFGRVARYTRSWGHIKLAGERLGAATQLLQEALRMAQVAKDDRLGAEISAQLSKLTGPA